MPICGPDTKNIVVLRSGAIGDCVVSTPLFRELRRCFPAARIAVIADPYSAPILEGCSHINQLLYLSHRGGKLPYFWKLLKLRRRKFDLVIDTQASGRSRIQVALLGGKRRISFDKKNWFANSFYTDLVPFIRSQNSVCRLASLLSPLGWQSEPRELEARVWVRDHHRDQACELLHASGVERPYAVLHVTTAGRPDYRVWPVARFAAIANHLHNLGFCVVVTSACQDREVRQVIDAASCPIHDVTGATEPLVLAALLEAAALYVGYNTGPMHVAAAVGTPIVGLFDIPTDPVEWHPWTRAPYRMLRAKPVDEPPGWRMDTVSTKEVEEAIRQVLVESQDAIQEREPLATAG